MSRKRTSYDPSAVAAAFLYDDDTPSFVVGIDGCIWFLRSLFDSDGDETDDIDAAVTAVAFNPTHGSTVVHLNLLHHPEIQ